MCMGMLHQSLDAVTLLGFGLKIMNAKYNFIISLSFFFPSGSSECWYCSLDWLIFVLWSWRIFLQISVSKVIISWFLRWECPLQKTQTLWFQLVQVVEQTMAFFSNFIKQEIQSFYDFYSLKIDDWEKSKAIRRKIVEFWFCASRTVESCFMRHKHTT